MESGSKNQGDNCSDDVGPALPAYGAAPIKTKAHSRETITGKEASEVSGVSLPF